MQSNSRLNNSRVNDSANNSRVNDSRANDSRANNSQVNNRANTSHLYKTNYQLTQPATGDRQAPAVKSRQLAVVNTCAVVNNRAVVNG